MSLIKESSIDLLIEEIEKRPALFKKNLKEYSDINIKKKLWDEVCEAVIPEWNQIQGEEKRKQGYEVQKKWNNLRTCFRRELNAQRDTKSGQATTKRRKYVYFEKLLFLLPCIENRPREGNLSPGDAQEEDDDDDEQPDPPTPALRRKKPSEPKQTPRNIVDEALLKALDDTKDEDTNFALSLVPSLAALTAEEKLDAKISILNIFKQIRMARRGLSSFQAPSYNYNIPQQPLSTFPTYLRGNNFSQIRNVSPVATSSPLPQVTQVQQFQSSNYTPMSTPSPNLPFEPIMSPPGCSNDSIQSHFSNYTADSELYDL